MSTACMLVYTHISSAWGCQKEVLDSLRVDYRRLKGIMWEIG